MRRIILYGLIWLLDWKIVSDEISAKFLRDSGDCLVCRKELSTVPKLCEKIVSTYCKEIRVRISF